MEVNLDSNRFFLLIGVFTVAALSFSIITLGHIIFKNQDRRNVPVWILAVLICPIIGVIIYWLVYNRDKLQARKFDPFRK